MKKNLVLGPFEGNTYLGLIGVKENSIYAIKLKMKSLIAYSINQQIPALFSNHFKDILAKSIDELILEYSFEKIKFDDIKNIKIVKSKFMNHAVIINSNSSKIKWNIIGSNMIENYESIFQEILKEKFVPLKK